MDVLTLAGFFQRSMQGLLSPYPVEGSGSVDVSLWEFKMDPKIQK